MYSLYAVLIVLLSVPLPVIPANVKLLLVVIITSILVHSSDVLENKVTGNQVVAKIGLASYSIYIWHQFVIKSNYRDELVKYLDDKGIGTIIHYPIPPHKQECYKDWNNRSYPITEKIHNQELSIPMNQVISREEAKEVVSVLNNFK